MIKVDTRDAIRDLTRLAQGHSKAVVNQAMLRAIKHTLGKAKTEANRIIRETYKIPVSQANKAMTVRTLRASSTEGPAGALMASSSRTSLAAFKPTLTTSSGMRMITTNQGFLASKAKKVRKVNNTQMQVEIIKGKRRTVNSAFFLPSSPRAVVMARGQHSSKKDFLWRHKRVSPTGPDNPIDALSTVSVFKAISTERAQQRISQRLAPDYEARFIHELGRLAGL